MRPIKFRGKVDGQWWYASPEDDSWEQFWALVDRKTVGQFTGLKDNERTKEYPEGKEIYEGDIISYKNAVIEWGEDGYCMRFRSGIAESGIRNDESEVIGNRFENPELLKRGEK